MAWLGVSPIVGFVVHDLVTRQREGETVLEEVVALTRRLTFDGQSREGICEAARAISGADLSYLFEPDGVGNLVSTADAGDSLPPVCIAMGNEPSGAAVAFATGQRLFVPDVVGHPAVSQRMVEATAIRSAVYQPVLRGDTPVGVLVLGWRSRMRARREPIQQGITLLAAEATVAMDRADRFAAVSELAAHDPLTGLANRRAWDAEVLRTIAEHHRTGQPLVLALADLDRFKDFNETYGHQAGDLLLKEAAAAWRSQLRANDLLARWGGEEFGILLDLDPDQARAVLDRLKAATPRQRTCSIGAALLESGDDLASLVARADLALYAAKQEGRDRVVVSR
ncbi:hypothetical protein BH18ACT1_BH18ACT1_01690 [soil metagenome]